MTCNLSVLAKGFLDPKGTEMLKERDGSPKAWLPLHPWSLFSLQLYTEKLLFCSFPVPDCAAMNWNTSISCQQQFHFSGGWSDSAMGPTCTLKFFQDLNAILYFKSHHTNENCFSILIKVKIVTYFSCFILSWENTNSENFK